MAWVCIVVIDQKILPVNKGKNEEIIRGAEMLKWCALVSHHWVLGLTLYMDWISWFLSLAKVHAQTKVSNAAKSGKASKTPKRLLFNSVWNLLQTQAIAASRKGTQNCSIVPCKSGYVNTFCWYFLRGRFEFPGTDKHSALPEIVNFATHDFRYWFVAEPFVSKEGLWGREWPFKKNGVMCTASAQCVLTVCPGKCFM